MLLVRSLVFTAFMLVSVVIFAIGVLLAAPLPVRWRDTIPPAWSRLTLAALKLICRLDYRVEGAENIPAEAAVAFWKHQSMWETLAQMLVFPRQCWVLKRELMAIPIVGWALRLYHPIAIDRGSGRRAVEQVIDQGLERLRAGYWVMIFPEGTRMPPGTTRRYGVSGILLAERAGKPIVPVAHNAGDYWRRNGWLKRPGTIVVRVGQPVATGGRAVQAVSAQIQGWIEAQMREISPGYAGISLDAGHPRAESSGTTGS